MQMRLPTNVLTTLQAVAKDQKSSVSKIMAEAMEKVVSGDMRIELPAENNKVASTSIYVDHDLQVKFTEVVKNGGLKVDKALKLLAEAITSGLAH